MKSRFLIAVLAFSVGLVVGLTTMYYLSLRANIAAADAAIVAASRSLSQSNLDAATAYAYTAITNNPEQYLAYALLGDIFVKRGNPVAAREMFSMALSKINSRRRQGKQETVDRRLVQDKLRSLEATRESKR